jgi:serine/threonine-protein kinase RsbW
MKIEIALCLPRDAKTVALVRSVAMGSLDQLGVESSCVEDIRIALSEACSNVIQHAEGEDDYDVILKVQDDECSISIIDTGAGIDPDTLEREMPDVSSSGGRGMALMSALVDRVKFINQPSAGMVVHLVKRLDLDPQGPLANLV